MKGSEARLAVYMQGSNKRFIIPVYQRNYDWKTENCKQLYDDLIKIKKNNRDSHFFGSIVAVCDSPNGVSFEYLIIDGQQRLTTVSLLLLAMYNLITQEKIKPQKSNLRERIYEEFLVDKYEDDDKKIKLKPVKNDKSAFDKLFKNPKDYIFESNLTINYNYFYDRIQKEELSIDDLFDAICRLEIISIQLNNDDNPQLIFESLNSTGLALSEGDKIRNYILMGLPSKLQNKYYEEYWNRIEEYTQYDVTSFIRDYLSVKTQVTPPNNKIYTAFKQLVEELKTETELLLKDMLEYAGWYEILLRGKTSSKQLNSSIYRLNRLETTVTRPFFLEVLRLNAEKIITIEEAAEIFEITETYIFRRLICELPTNSLNKIFLLLHKEIIRYDGTTDKYVSKFKYALLNKKEKGRFPDNDDFIEQLSTRPIYQMNSKNKIYLLERIENYNTSEDKDVYKKFDSGIYSIEHIMPQHLSPKWQEELGKDYESIHETWLHRLANLTLTAYNSSYSNNTFEDKKNMPHGFVDSGIRMNQKIAKNNKWTLREIEQRNADIQDIALKIWGMPSTDFIPSIEELDSVSLDDDVELSGKKIAKFSYKNSEQPVESWKEMFINVINILHTDDRSVLLKLAITANNDSDLACYVSHNKTDLRDYIEIEHDLYIERNTSTSTKLSILKKLFSMYNADAGDLIFYLRNEDKCAEKDNINKRENLHRKYWAFAMDYIHKAHENGGIFQNVNTTKTDTISGGFGVQGCSVYCFIQNNLAGVGIAIAKKSKDKNKLIYDELYKHKNEIEKALGVELNWYRLDEKKSSYVSYYLHNVSKKDENDWIQIAKFHAEWSRKLYDVIVPFIR
ncbi:MAG TPA: DUF4268 domain-containing protein [Ruminococcus sp.]|nr:DUF4268 domain-containing protein [Ruminococcus sp.]